MLGFLFEKEKLFSQVLSWPPSHDRNQSGLEGREQGRPAGRWPVGCAGCENETGQGRTCCLEWMWCRQSAGSGPGTSCPGRLRSEQQALDTSSLLESLLHHPERSKRTLLAEGKLPGAGLAHRLQREQAAHSPRAAPSTGVCAGQGQVVPVLASWLTTPSLHG